MKKLLLILMLLTLVVALVACGGEKTPDVTEGPATTTKAPTTTAPAAKYTVKFVDAEEFGGKVLSETSVSRGKPARAPLNPSQEGYVFLGWDVEDYSSIMADTVITAMYRPFDTYTVTFYDADGTQLGDAIQVTEGEDITAKAPATKKVIGKLFAGWDKQIGKVDRAWSDFDQYKDLSEEEIAATTLNYKVTAIYEDADGIIAYKDKISMEFKEIKDANGNKAYEPVDSIFVETTAKFTSMTNKVYKGSTAEDQANNNANFSIAWDGEFVYVYARVYDPTVLTRGKAYCEGIVNPWQNDSVEVYYCFNVEPSENTRQVVKIDAYGYRKYSDDGSNGAEYPEMSKWFADIEVVHAQAPEADSYYAIFKIPAKQEDGTALTVGDVGAFSEQINDLRSTDDLDNMYCSGGKRDYENWKSFSFDGK